MGAGWGFRPGCVRVDLRLAPLDRPAFDGRQLRGEGPWRVREGGAPIAYLADTVGVLERVAVVGGWLVGYGFVEARVDLAAVAPEIDLGDTQTVDDESGWRVFLYGRVDRVVLGTNPTFDGPSIAAAGS